MAIIVEQPQHVSARVGEYLQAGGVSEDGAREVMAVFSGMLEDAELMERVSWHVGGLKNNGGPPYRCQETVGEPDPALETLFKEILRLIDAPAAIFLSLLAREPTTPDVSFLPIISLFLATVYLYELRLAAEAPTSGLMREYLPAACGLVSTLEI